MNVSNTKKAIKKIAFTALSIGFLFSSIGNSDAYGKTLPKYTEVATYDKVMQVLDKYDPDGAVFVRYTHDNDNKELPWYNPGDRIIDSLDTEVHEDCHYYTQDKMNNQKYSERIYCGNGKYITVDWDRDTIPATYEAAAQFPTKYRTGRYGIYVHDDYTAVSNQYGPYGMLNEFNAYSWGLHNGLCMYNYIKDTKNKATARKELLGIVRSNIEAYSEFHFYVISYMEYARKHYPDVYAYIGNDKDFLEAYNDIEKRFTTDINKAMKLFKGTSDYDGVVEMLKADNVYYTLTSECNKKKYDEVKKALAGAGVDTSVYKWDQAVRWESIDNLSFNGTKIRISYFGQSDKYYIYRKTNSGKFKKLGSTTEDYYDDTTIVAGNKYTYKVMPVKLQSDGAETKGTYTGSVSCITHKAVKVTSAKLNKKGEIVVKWKAPEKNVVYYVVNFTYYHGMTEEEYYNQESRDGLSFSQSSIGHYVYKGTKLVEKPQVTDKDIYVSVTAYFTDDGLETTSPKGNTIVVKQK